MPPFIYVPGTDAPLYSGFAEFPGVRFGYDGTFRADDIPPIYQSAPLRLSAVDLPRDGVTVPPVLLDGWQFTLGGELRVDDPDDVQAAKDYLRSKVNVGVGWTTLTLNALGWTGKRQMTVMVAGQITIPDPDGHDARRTIGNRDITIPLIAADARQYSVVLQAVDIGTGTTLTNAGDYPAPFTVRFNGPLTNPRVDGPGTAGTNRIELARDLAAGEWVDVTTWDDGVTTAVDDAGVNAIGDVNTDTASVIMPGDSDWTASADAGSGVTTISFRDTWA